MRSYRLPRQHARSELQLLKITGKTKLVIYRFYFFVENLPNSLTYQRLSSLVKNAHCITSSVTSAMLVMSETPVATSSHALIDTEA